MQMGLLLSYPILMHLSVVLQFSELAILAILFFAAGIFYTGLRRKQKNSIIAFLSISTIVTLLFSFSEFAWYLFYLPSVLIPLLLGWGFTRTLFPGQEPLVTDIGEKARGPLSEEMRRYTRKVTWIWAISLNVMAFTALVLIVFGTREMWSLMTNIVNYIWVGVLFLGEFILRKRLFADHDHPKFYDYIKIVFNSQSNSKE